MAILSITTLILCLATINPSLGLRYVPQDGTIIDKICRDGNVQSFYDSCAQLFDSDPRSSKSDLKGLARIALEKSALTVARSLVSMDNEVRLGVGSKNDTIRVKLMQCSDRYSQIIYDVAEGFKSATIGDFNAVGNSALAIIGQTHACQDGFVGPVEVFDTTTRVHNLAVIVSVIATLSGSS
ncbi:Pectinesterase inhibitor [Linum grandiflorum]